MYISIPYEVIALALLSGRCSMNNCTPMRHRFPMEINADTRTDDILERLAAARSIFRNHGIDPDLVAGLTLAEAASRSGRDVSRLVQSLRATYQMRNNPRAWPEEWSTGTPEEIIQVVEDLYHEALRRFLPQIGARLSVLLRERGEDYPELFDVGRVFERFCRQVQGHIEQETTLIFPSLCSDHAREENARSLAKSMKADHGAIALTLRDMRDLTLNYPLRRTSDTNVAGLYEMWREAESLISRAMYLEENWLLPLTAESTE